MSGASRQLTNTSGSMSRFLANASAFSKIAMRFFSMCKNVGTEAAYIPNDIADHLHERVTRGRDLSSARRDAVITFRRARVGGGQDMQGESMGLIKGVSRRHLVAGAVGALALPIATRAAARGIEIPATEA